MNIQFLCQKNFSIFILKNIYDKINDLPNKKEKNKIFAAIDRLSERIPKNPDQWEKIKSCKGLYELKPKPYRLGCYKKGDNVLILHLWKVQKKKSKVKQKEIEKACEVMKEVRDEFEQFICQRKIFSR